MFCIPDNSKIDLISDDQFLQTSNNSSDPIEIEMEREKSQPNVTLLIEVMPEETRIRTPTMNDISLNLEPGAEETLGLEFIDADQDLVEGNFNTRLFFSKMMIGHLNDNYTALLA